MADEPTPGELSRLISSIRDDQRNGFAAINSRLDKLVSTELFSADQRRVDERLKDLAEDVAGERAARVKSVEEERAARQKLAEENGKRFDQLATFGRWLVAVVLVPVALFVANIIIARQS